MERKMLRYGQIGGTLDAFIGGVHRKAIAIDEQAQLVAGCFSQRNSEKNLACGTHYGLSRDRIYGSYAGMIEAESARNGDDRLDFIVVCTPNDTHYDICRMAVEADFNVVCEKPLCFTPSEAEHLATLVREHDVLFGVTYTYTGYNMVKQARQIVSSGQIGRVIDVKAEYLQDWLMSQLGGSSDREAKLSVWRMDPKKSGAANCVGDIGTHIECTVSYITGLRVKRLMAMLDRFGCSLDLNANMLVEFDNGAHGTFSCSQVAAGHYNGLRIRIFGEKGSLEWEQEHPDFLKLTVQGQPTQILTRAAHSTDHALQINRIPSGHPEGLTMAFANIYRTYTTALLNRLNGVGNNGEWDLDFPSVEDGLSGVRFVDAAVRSSANGGEWVTL